MSKSSLQSFEYKIKTEDSIADDVKSDMENIGKSINGAMNDRVGQSAIISIKRIGDVFESTIKNIISPSNHASGTLRRGYDEIDSLSCEGDNCLSRAESLIRELGDI